jgi:hypothetical protein
VPPTDSAASISSRVHTPTRLRAFSRVRCLWYSTKAKVSVGAQPSAVSGSGIACRIEMFSALTRWRFSTAAIFGTNSSSRSTGMKYSCST